MGKVEAREREREPACATEPRGMHMYVCCMSVCLFRYASMDGGDALLRCSLALRHAAGSSLKHFTANASIPEQVYSIQSTNLVCRGLVGRRVDLR